jgi:hypothetical protein
MTRLIPIAAGTVAMLATAVGGAATQVSPDWTVDLRTVFAVGGIVIPGVWWLGAKFRGITDQLSSAQEVFTKFEKRFDELQAHLDKLPCQQPNSKECSPQQAKKQGLPVIRHPSSL